MTDEAPETIPTPAEASPRSLYKYSVWAHAGHGAEDCSEVDENAGTNACGDPGHFHAWCRLPNTFQQRDIRERALAAKARRVRQLNLQGSDANEILEQSLEELQGAPDAKEQMIAELLGYDWFKDYLESVREVQDRDDTSEDAEEGAKLFEHIADDEGRFARLAGQSAEERNQDEYEELEAHLAAYSTAVQETLDAAVAPRRASFEEKEDHELVALVRRKRIESTGQDEFMHHYSIHSWLSCCYKALDGETSFRNLAHLEGAAPEVLECLELTFRDLERTAQDSLGN